MTPNISFAQESAVITPQPELSLVYFDSSAYYDWERHWEEEE